MCNASIGNTTLFTKKVFVQPNNDHYYFNHFFPNFLQIAKVREETSVLFVCIMSHGIRGHIHGSDNVDGSINTVMYDMRCEIPNYIPMVSLFSWFQRM